MTHPVTDPLDDLKAAFAAATPPPDAQRKAEILTRAEKDFADLQGSANAPRPTSDRPAKWAGLITGVGQMFATLTTRPALTASTAIVAVGLVALVPVLRNGPPDLPGLTGERQEIAIEENPQTDDVAFDVTAPVLEPEPAPLRSRIQAEHDAPAAADTETLTFGTTTFGTTAENLHAAPPGPLAKIGRNMGNDRVLGLLSDQPAVETYAPTPTDLIVREQPNTEAFANDAPNPVKATAQDPVSTFSIDVDTASYSVVRSSLMNGYMPDPQSVRVEEMVNYFPYAYAAPDADEGPFKPTVTIGQTPWNANTQLLHIALQGEMPDIADRPALNLVFLIDTSGSMNQPDKLPLLKQSFRLMLGQLRPQDEVSIVAYAGSAGRVLDPTPASERSTILAALDRLDAGGSTAGQEGLQLAYATAESMVKDGEVSRVILATDGDFNVGISDPEALEKFIAKKRDGGTYLSVLGFGRGNLDDATMQALAQNGNGQAAYIDTLSEAQKVLVDQLTGALFPIANDVKIQVEFNPAEIAEYRLIGYETRALRREDFNNDKVDAGEIGAGHSVTAIYELTPVGSPAILNDPLRYSSAATATAENGELAFLRLRYKKPGEDVSHLMELPITANIGEMTNESRFAAAIAGFGQLLQDSSYTGDWTYGDAITLAESATGADPFGYRREAITLMRLAQSLEN